MYTEIIKIIEGGLDKDKEKVINYSNLLAQKLSEQGEKKMAEKIQKLITSKSVHPVYLDELISTPVDQETRMSIVDVSMNYPVEENSIVLPESIKLKLEDFIESIKYKEQMQKMGLDLISTLLLYGPPGCGKTTIAHYLSNRIQMPLVTARLDTMISSLLGNTAKNIRMIFDFAKRKPCILFLDEFDAIAKARDDQHELGELKRVVNSLLQNIDEFSKDNILIAATNHQNLLDDAIWRRFTSIIEIPKPLSEDIIKLIKMFFKDISWDFENDLKKADTGAKLLENLSPSDIKNICYNAIKKCVISGENAVSFHDFIYEVYLYKTHSTFSQKDIVKFLNDSGVSQANIAKTIKISLRQVRNFLGE